MWYAFVTKWSLYTNFSYFFDWVLMKIQIYYQIKNYNNNKKQKKKKLFGGDWSTPIGHFLAYFGYSRPHPKAFWGVILQVLMVIQPPLKLNDGGGQITLGYEIVLGVVGYPRIVRWGWLSHPYSHESCSTIPRIDKRGWTNPKGFWEWFNYHQNQHLVWMVTLTSNGYEDGPVTSRID
jgi:hypothetical protein